MDKRMARFSTALDYDAIRDADLVIEAVFEDIGVKEAVFRKLDETMKPGAILASNTSTLDLDRIASFTKRPGDVDRHALLQPGERDAAARDRARRRRRRRTCSRR